MADGPGLKVRCMMFAKLSAEFLGTFWLVLGGCGSAVLAAAFPELGIGLLGVSLAFGLTVLFFISSAPSFGAIRNTRSAGTLPVSMR
jgi:glycerol uptake facilitator-like aquaporin